MTQAEYADPDCYTCCKWDTCENAVAGHFCPMWQSKLPDEDRPDPNDAWEKGEEWNE